jgi:hypothetical protein
MLRLFEGTYERESFIESGPFWLLLWLTNVPLLPEYFIFSYTQGSVCRVRLEGQIDRVTQETSTNVWHVIFDVKIFTSQQGLYGR